MDKREKVRAGLHALYLPYYDKLCTLLGEEWQPYCGIRTEEEQIKALTDKASNAGPWESPHNYGMATDWCLWEGSKPTWPPAGDTRWEPYVTACRSVGLQAGADFKSLSDYPHNELKISISWKSVKDKYLAGGITQAIEFIKSVAL